MQTDVFSERRKVLEFLNLCFLDKNTFVNVVHFFDSHSNRRFFFRLINVLNQQKRQVLI